MKNLKTIIKNKLKNFYFSFGYRGDYTKLNLFTYNLCKILPFIPTIEMNLFKTYHNSDVEFDIKHSMHFGIFNFYCRLEKVKGIWKYKNLTNC